MSGLLHVIFSSPSKESIYNSLVYISSTAPEVSFSRQQFGGDDERKFRRPVDASARKPPRRRWIPGYTDIPSVVGIIVYSLFHRVRRNGSVAHRLDGLRKARFDAFHVDIRRLSRYNSVGSGCFRIADIRICVLDVVAEGALACCAALRRHIGIRYFVGNFFFFRKLGFSVSPFFPVSTSAIVRAGALSCTEFCLRLTNRNRPAPHLRHRILHRSPAHLPRGAPA